MDIIKEFGSTLKKLRKEKGLSQEKFALLASIDRTYISDIEKGERNISLLTLQKISIALQIPMSEIIKRIEDNG